MFSVTFIWLSLLQVSRLAHCTELGHENGHHHDSSLPVALPWMQSASPSVSTEPTFVLGEWTKCSAVCGEGTRERSVECKILLQFSRTVAKLPDAECPGQKPPSVTRCHSRPCSSFDGTSKLRGLVSDEATAALRSHKPPISEASLAASSSPSSSSSSSRSSSSVVSGHHHISKQSADIGSGFVWKTAGWTECSASCLGGTQESIIQCVRLKDQLVVSPYLCDITDKPDSLTRTCNDIPCPPRWVVSEYSACSKECGNGVQTRQVQCIHEVARGPENALTIAHGHCPQPAPTSTQQCSLAECPARWEAGPWRKCSRHCGSGIKSRSVKCVRELSLGQVIEVPAGHCPAHRQPHLRKVCNKRHCKKLGPHEPLILPADNGVYVQKEPLSRLSIKVGGRAIVFAGTTLKIRCPRTRSANKTHDLKVDWYRDGHKIASSKKYQQTARHALRVRHIGISDSGRYTCSLGASEASILVTVRPPPSSSSVASSTGIEPARMPGDTFDNKANPWDTSQRANGTVDRFSSGPDDDYEENKLATHDDDHDDGHIDEPVYLRGEGSLTTDQPVGQTWDSYGHQERAAQGSYYASDQRTPSGEFDSDFDGDLYASYSSSTTESAITVSSTSSFYYFTVNANSVTDYTADPVYVNNARSRGYQRQPAMSQLRAYLTQLTSSFMGHIGDNVDSPDKLIAETNNNSDHNMADTSQATGDKMPWICHRHCLSPPLPHHRCVILCH